MKINEKLIKNTNVLGNILDYIRQQRTQKEEGTTIQFKNTIMYPCLNCLFKGNLSQETTTGKNLLRYPYSESTKKNNGINFIDNGDGTVTANGTSTEESLFSFFRGLPANSGLETNKTYYLSNDKIIDNAPLSVYQKIEGEWRSAAHTLNQREMSFTINKNATELWIRITIRSATTLNNVVYKPMITTSPTTEKEYESFTGGNASPNLDFPMPVKVVTGNDAIMITGKNLWSSEWEQGVIDSSGNFIYTKDFIRTKNYLKVEPNTHYAIKRSIVGGYLAVRGYDKNMNFVGTGGNVINLISGSTANNPMIENSSTCVISPKEGIYYLKFNENTNDLSTQYMMVEGDTPENYEPYKSQNYTIPLGNMELCKIGDYQDYIYKSNNKWYKHKVIDKLVLNGAETWVIVNSGADSYYYERTLSSGKYQNSANVTGHLYCNKYQYGSIYISNTENGIWIANSIRIRYGEEKALNDFKAELSEENLILYAVLVTPVEEEITDTTLIDALDKFEEEAHSYSEETNVTITAENGNETMIINLEALVDINKTIEDLEKRVADLESAS